MRSQTSLLFFALAAVASAQYQTHNLVSDGSIPADHTDPNLVNAWGISSSGAGPWWVSNNGTNTSTLYNGTGTPQALVVSTQPKITGQVFNGSSGFAFTANGKTGASRFIFASENGTISAWAPSVDGTNAHVTIDRSGQGANYKGLGISGNRLFAADFAGGMIDVFDSSFNYLSSFTDALVDPAFSPFNVQQLGGELYVTYAKKGAGGVHVSGAGNGFISVFDTAGNLLRQLGTNVAMDSPWGIALAPSDFGTYSGALLVGNQGDGHINAFDKLTGAFLGTLEDYQGAIEVDGLWGLGFGNGGNAGPKNTLYFAAGPGGGGHGLFGQINAVPEPATLVALGLGVTALLRRRRSQ